jgi:hypothetical protein
LHHSTKVSRTRKVGGRSTAGKRERQYLANEQPFPLSKYANEAIPNTETANWPRFDKFRYYSGSYAQLPRPLRASTCRFDHGSGLQQTLLGHSGPVTQWNFSLKARRWLPTAMITRSGSRARQRALSRDLVHEGDRFQNRKSRRPLDPMSLAFIQIADCNITVAQQGFRQSFCYRLPVVALPPGIVGLWLVQVSQAELRGLQTLLLYSCHYRMEVLIRCIHRTGNLREIHPGLAYHVIRVWKSVFMFPEMEGNSGRHCISCVQKCSLTVGFDIEMSCPFTNLGSRARKVFTYPNGSPFGKWVDSWTLWCNDFAL